MVAAPISPSVRSSFDQFLEGLRAEGFQVVDVDEPSLDSIDASSAASGLEILEIHGEQFAQHRDRYGADLQVRLDSCSKGTVNDVLAAQRWAAAARNTIARLDRNGIGLLVSPTVGSMTKDIGVDDIEVSGVRYPHREILAPFTAPINHIGVPALASPIAGGSGVPASIQLIGSMWQERRILTVAAQLESAGLLSSGNPPDYSE